MYVLSHQLSGLPVLSLQTGQPVAIVESAIIEPSHLEMVALLCQPQKPLVLPVITPLDIRQISADGVIVDSEEVLTDAEDIVRLAPLLKLKHFPIGVTVTSDLGRKLGHTEEFTINLENFQIQKLHVKPTLIHSWLSGSLIVDRGQIIDIKPQQIIVRDVTVEAPLPATGTVPGA